MARSVVELHPREFQGLRLRQLLSAVRRACVIDEHSIHMGGDVVEAALYVFGLVLDDHAQGQAGGRLDGHSIPW